MTCGCPHITPLRRRGLGGELGSAYDRCAGALWFWAVVLLVCWIRAAAAK